MTVKELAAYLKIAEKTADGLSICIRGQGSELQSGKRVAVSQKRDRPLDQ